MKPLLLTIKLLEKFRKIRGEKQLVGADGVPAEILKLGGKALTAFLARLLEVT